MGDEVVLIGRQGDAVRSRHGLGGRRWGRSATRCCAASGRASPVWSSTPRPRREAPRPVTGGTGRQADEWPTAGGAGLAGQRGGAAGATACDRRGGRRRGRGVGAPAPGRAPGRRLHRRRRGRRGPGPARRTWPITSSTSPTVAALHVIERGEGPPLVLLHGLMLSSALWVHQLRDLADRHRVITIDLSGPRPVDPRDRPVRRDGRDLASPPCTGCAADVWAVLEALDVRDALLVGHSMGGMTALQLALDAPAEALARRVAGLALVSTTAGPVLGHRPVPGPRPRLGGGGVVACRPGRRSRRRPRPAVAGPALVGEPARLRGRRAAGPGPLRRAHAHGAVRRGSSASCCRRWPPSTSPPASPRSSCRPLVVVGTHDRVIPPRHARRLAAGLPRAELVELPRCGHQPMLERRNEFNRLLDEFSAKLG